MRLLALLFAVTGCGSTFAVMRNDLGDTERCYGTARTPEVQRCILLNEQAGYRLVDSERPGARAARQPQRGFNPSAMLSEMPDDGPCDAARRSQMASDGASPDLIKSTCGDYHSSNVKPRIDPRSIPSPDLIVPGRGSFKIERWWTEYGVTSALVKYINTTDHTFTAAVTIGCSAFDYSQRIDYHERSFFASDSGAMPPGFEGVLKIPASLTTGSVSRVECDIVKAR